MFATGLLYLLFEDTILANSSTTAHSIGNCGSRMVLGLQVGVVLLSLIVTRSSVASLQAKQGVPLGNLVVGWFVLGMLLWSS